LSARAVGAGLLAIALGLASACARAEPPPVPLLWKVSDADNTVYLLGSFHALRPSDYPLAPAVDAAFADAESIAFELAPGELESPTLGADMLAAATFPAGKDLRGAIPPAMYAKLEAYAQTRGLSYAVYGRSEPWFVALVVTMTEMKLAGLDPQQGLDRHLISLAAEKGKPASGLETGRQQIDALDGMTVAEQQQMLDEALDSVAGFKAELDKVHGLWRGGDEKSLHARLAVDLRKRYPQLYQSINVGRNRAWLPKVRAMLDAEHEDDALVVVGTLHLLGDDGLVAMLRQQGYTVERIK
jgi:uncharacterized protein YbaP (TraB family)